MDRRLLLTVGDRIGQDAVDLATTPEMKQLLMNYDRRLCVIVCDELSRQLVFIHLCPPDIRVLVRVPNVFYSMVCV